MYSQAVVARSVTLPIWQVPAYTTVAIRTSVAKFITMADHEWINSTIQMPFHTD